MIPALIKYTEIQTIFINIHFVFFNLSPTVEKLCKGHWALSSDPSKSLPIEVAKLKYCDIFTLFVLSPFQYKSLQILKTIQLPVASHALVGFISCCVFCVLSVFLSFLLWFMDQWINMIYEKTILTVKLYDISMTVSRIFTWPTKVKKNSAQLE